LKINNINTSLDSNVESRSSVFANKKSISKILLIQPPAFCNNMRDDMNPNVPLGIAYIAACLEKENYTVKILDAFIEGWDIEERIDDNRLRVGLSFQEIIDYIAEYLPDVVGITSMFTAQRKNVHDLAKIIRTSFNNITTIVGGAHPTAMPEDVICDENIDFAVLGEGENIVLELLERIELGEDISMLQGLAFIDSSGKMIINDNNPGIEDLDAIPFPARHLLPMNKYFDAGVRHGGVGKGMRAASLITSRGCPYKCNFCTAFKVFTRRTRMRSVANVIAEIKHLKKTYLVDEIYFEDDQLLAKRSRSLELLSELAKIKVFWDTPNGISPWLLTEEIIDKMAESGCYRINIAIESGVQEVLDDIINKPVKLIDIPNIVKTIKKHDMEVYVFLVVGNFSWDKIESISQIKDSFKFCRKLSVLPHVSLLTAYPGSETLAIAKSKGYLVDGFSWDNLVIDQMQLTTPDWSYNELLDVVKRERIITKLYILSRTPFHSLYYILYKLIFTPFDTLKKIKSHILGLVR